MQLLLLLCSKQMTIRYGNLTVFVDLQVLSYPRCSSIFQVSSKSVQGFRNSRGGNMPFPITLATAFYNTLYYGTSCDNIPYQNKRCHTQSMSLTKLTR